MKRRLLSLARIIAAGIIVSGAQAQDLARPLLLVATPELQGLYSRSALIVVPSADRHIGFIVNRATEVTLAALFPEHAPSAKVLEPVRFGGPQMLDAIFAVVRSNPGVDAVPLFGGLYLVASAETVDRVIEQTPADARFFAGFVAWLPGELAKEIEARYWYVSEPDSALIFRSDTTHLWEELIERRRFLSASLAIR